jgi:hypothetical protein
MSITGSLTDFSLREMFQFLDRGHKTGLLTLSSSSASQGAPPSSHYIWVSKGSIVGAANQLNHHGLISLIDQYQWVSNRVVTKLAQFCPTDKPFGLYLRSQGVLQVEQLEHLFQIQVFQQVCVLSQLKDAQFRFDQNVPIPMREMTGLSVSAIVLQVMLQKLVLLQKIFEARRLQQETRGLCNQSEAFCNQLGLILDIAFFHSLNFSLFDSNNTFTRLSQLFELCERPYDLPKARVANAMCCVEK